MSRLLPILFNTEMVRAILDGRKTVTRRVIKPQPETDMIYKLGYCIDGSRQDIGKFGFGSHECGGRVLYVKPPYQPGDTLYVRETWCGWYLPHGEWAYRYKATDPNGNRVPSGPEYDDEWKTKPWRPSIHMPKEAARIWLKVMDVRVERLQDITDDQAKKEGICEEWAMAWWKPTYNDPDSGGYPCYRDTFANDLWDSVVKTPDLDRYGWDANPWVWVIEFERCEKPETETECFCVRCGQKLKWNNNKTEDLEK